jgi:Na+-translocating ferredoxin:NAD+ oxidoreductase RnfG subunit
VISKQGYVNDIELLALLEGTTIRQIKGLNVKESKNYGAKCFNDNFLSQFYGIDLAAAAPLSGRQDNYEDGDILYVTRATKTSRAIITAINAAALFLREME